jgi:hypothetical protein
LLAYLLGMFVPWRLLAVIGTNQYLMSECFLFRDM